MSWFFPLSAIGDKQSENRGQEPGAKWSCCFPGHRPDSQVKHRTLYRCLRRLLHLLSSVAVVKARTALIISDKAYLVLHTPLPMWSLKNYYTKFWETVNKTALNQSICEDYFTEQLEPWSVSTDAKTEGLCLTLTKMSAFSGRSDSARRTRAVGHLLVKMP